MNAVMDMADAEGQRLTPGLCFSEGIYYAEVSHPASETPIRVALHGIQTWQQACEAWSVLGGNGRCRGHGL